MCVLMGMMRMCGGVCILTGMMRRRWVVCVCSHGTDENVRWRVCSHGNDEEKLGGVCVSEEEGGGWGSCSVCAVPSTGKGITAKGAAMSHFMCQCDWVTGRPR